jgi:hypothetical protein
MKNIFFLVAYFANTDLSLLFDGDIQTTDFGKEKFQREYLSIDSYQETLSSTLRLTEMHRR